MATARGQTLYVYGVGLAYEVRPDGSRGYYHSDFLGSTRVVTDDAGVVVSAFNYDAYGALRQSTGEGRGFTYTREQTDPESGLEFLRARYYDPGTGRFIQKDRLQGNPLDRRTLNRHTYALNNPAGYTDPSGNAVPAVLIAMITSPKWGPVVVAGGFFLVIETRESILRNSDAINEAISSAWDRIQTVTISQSQTCNKGLYTASSALRHALGLDTGDGLEAHH